MDAAQRERLDYLEHLRRKFTEQELREYLALLEVTDPLHSDSDSEEADDNYNYDRPGRDVRNCKATLVDGEK